jgi:phosphoglycolate phosphatase
MMSKSPFLLLFDIDGTLLNTRGAGMRAMREIGLQMFGQEFKWEGISPGGKLDPQIIGEALQLNDMEMDAAAQEAFHDRYIPQLAKELAAGADTYVMPGIFEILTVLRDRADVHLGLLTGNFTRAVPLKLAAANIDFDWFGITAFGDEATTRPGLTAVAMDKYETRLGHRPNPDRVILIGDTPRDVDAAHSHGCVACAVATGPHSFDELQETGAAVVVEDLSDPTPLLDLLK